MKALLKLALAACLPVLSAGAAATNMSVTLHGYAHPNPIAAAIDIDSPDHARNINAGAFVATSSYGSHSSDFDAWCLDVFQNAVFGTPVGKYKLSSGIRALGADKAGKMTALATQRLPLVTGAQASAAFQLALWEILYEHPGTRLNLYEGNFEASTADNAAVNLANAWLSNLDVNVQSAYRLDVLSHGKYQDYGVFVPKPGKVPEPATLALLGVGLLGVSALRRKRV